MTRDKVRFGLYGCGPGRTKQLVAAALRGWPDSIAVTACFDVDRDKAENMAQQYHAKACGDLRSFQKADFDVAIVCLPPFLHPSAFAACAEAGKNIYLEKPVCADDAGKAQLIAAMEKFKPLCYVGLSLSCIMPYRKALEIRRRAECGAFIACQVYRWGAKTGQLPPQLNWRHRLEQSGGELNQHCCHEMHYLRLVAGEPESVVAMACTSESFHPAHEEEEVTACFRCKPGMAVFALSQRAHRRHGGGQINMENLSIQMEWAAHSSVRLYKQRPRAPEEIYEWDHSMGVPANEDMTFVQMNDFLDAYRNGRPMPITLADGIQAYEMIKAIRESVRRRREVAIPEPIRF